MGFELNDSGSTHQDDQTMQQMDREIVENYIISLSNSFRGMGFNLNEVVLGSDLPLINSPSVGIPCSVSHSQPANQLRLTGDLKMTVTFERQPLFPDWLVEALTGTSGDTESQRDT